MTKKDTKKQDEELESEEKIEEPESLERNLKNAQPSHKVTAGEDELEQLKQKLEVSDNSYKRALADYQNLQKRVNEQRSELILSANKDLLLRILSVLDTLVLAQKHDGSEGLKVSISKFLDVLKAEGVSKIETVGKQFNPEIMEAISTEEGKDGEVLEEIQTGYLLNDKLLRAALVKVGKKD
ncbi:MAG TPA: nucleotide exchange factor GrpE [Candidatus Saccharimonadales bacterium]|nr:nucleotide exchange factor GrpE [Candidatus Saccharimonadales bacterium]